MKTKTEQKEIENVHKMYSKEILKLEKQLKELKNTKVLITIEGGICQGVMSNNLKNIRVVVVDYDKNGDEPAIVSEQQLEKLKPENFYELFTDKSDSIEMHVRDEMKRLKF